MQVLLPHPAALALQELAHLVELSQAVPRPRARLVTLLQKHALRLLAPASSV